MMTPLPSRPPPAQDDYDPHEQAAPAPPAQAIPIDDEDDDDDDWQAIDDEDEDDDYGNRSAGGFGGRVKRTLPRLAAVNEDGWVF
jgi:hypothetical protein